MVMQLNSYPQNSLISTAISGKLRGLIVPDLMA
jgi:hypothetical protein